MEAVILAIAEFIQIYWAYIALLLPVIAGGIGLLLEGRLKGETQRVVGAVYRVSIKAARDFEEQGLAWLVSPDGVAFRKGLAENAYDALPARVGWLPVGILKSFVSRELFVVWVEKAFVEMVELADRLEDYLPAEI